MSTMEQVVELDMNDLEWDEITEVKQKTPESRKNRKGKLLPSELVAWSEYDKCLDVPQYAYSKNYLLAVVQDMRHHRIERVRLHGRTLINAIVDCGRSPELELMGVYELGADKYGAYSWQNGVEVSLLCDAAWRHINAYLQGFDVNKDDGNFLHLTHALWQVLAILWMLENRPEFVDVT